MGSRKADAADFHSEDDQTAAIREAADRLGGRLDLLPSELDVSGGLPLDQRPALRAAVEGIEDGRYCGVIVAYHSRLGRDVEGEEMVWRRVEAAGGSIHIALDGLDTSTADGRMVRRIKSAMNAAERERHAQRFEDLRRASTERGIWQRRQTPLGYRRDEDKASPTWRKLVPDDRADDLRWAFGARAEGVNARVIGERLGMTPSGARHLLKNRVYLGELRVGQHVNVSAHAPLVDEPTWAAAQRFAARPTRSERPPALLAGLVRCASCGHVMTRSGTAKNPVYTCPRFHSGGACPRPAAVTCRVLDEYVERIALAELERLRVTASKGDSVQCAQDAVEAAQQELNAYLEAISASVVGVEAFQAGAKQRADALAAAREALDVQRARQPFVPVTGTGADAWERLNGHERNALLRALLAAVVVRPVGRGKRTPLEDRVRLLAHGAAVTLARGRGGRAAGIVPIPLPDLDSPDVLRLPAGEDRL